MKRREFIKKSAGLAVGLSAFSLGSCRSGSARRGAKSGRQPNVVFFLADDLGWGDISRAMIQQVIKAGGVKVNGNAVKPSFQLSAGDKIDLILPEPVSKEIEAENIPLDIIYEDDSLIIVNKQADIVVHPARGNRRLCHGKHRLPGRPGAP